VHLIITGGTIDKRYNELTGAVDFAPTSHIQTMLAQARVDTTPHTLTPLLLKDSLQLTLEDREAILTTLQGSHSNQILITHGTDTMVKTAKFLASYRIDKTIVLVGAMIPYRFKDSDALFNLGFAMGALQNLVNGVYIAMNGKIFNYDDVAKNRTLGLFEAVGV